MIGWGEFCVESLHSYHLQEVQAKRKPTFCNVSYLHAGFCNRSYFTHSLQYLSFLRTRQCLHVIAYLKCTIVICGQQSIHVLLVLQVFPWMWRKGLSTATLLVRIFCQAATRTEEPHLHSSDAARFTTGRARKLSSDYVILARPSASTLYKEHVEPPEHCLSDKLDWPRWSRFMAPQFFLSVLHRLFPL